MALLNNLQSNENTDSDCLLVVTITTTAGKKFAFLVLICPIYKLILYINNMGRISS